MRAYLILCGDLDLCNAPCDPFFEGLKPDIQDGVDEIDRGDTVPADEVRAHFERRIAALPQDAPE